MSESRNQPPAAAARAVTLRDRVRIGQRRQQTLAGALVVVAALGTLGVYRPTQQAIASARETIVELDAQRSANQSRASALPQLMSRVDELKRQVDGFKPLPRPSDIQRAFAQITQIKNETAVSAYKFETSDAARALGSCLEQRVRITFQADFIDAMSFVKKIEDMDRLTRVRELRMTGRRPDGQNPAATAAAAGRVTVEMSLSLFFRTNEDALPAARGGGR